MQTVFKSAGAGSLVVSEVLYLSASSSKGEISTAQLASLSEVNEPALLLSQSMSSPWVHVLE